MSSLADTPSPVRRLRRALPRPRAGSLAVPAVGVDAAVCGAVAVVLAAVSFGASGGTDLPRTTVVEVLLTLGGAGMVATALLLPRPHADSRLHGAWTLAGLAALTALTALSITWSLDPGASWREASRMLAYLAAFAGALALVRLVPDRWPAVIGGVALGCVTIVVGALATKVLPGSLAAEETFARLRAPFGYWNGIGLTAALAVVPLLWLAAKRSGNLALNALAYPALGLCFVCLLLSYSRGALLALAVGVIFWLVVVPLRLRATAALVVSALAAAPVVAWAFAREALTEDGAILLARSEAGRELGALLLLMVAVLLATALAIGFAAANRPPTPQVRRRAGQGLVALLAIVVLAGIGVVATKPGGLDGQVSTAYSQLTDPDAGTPDNAPGRLTATASVRSRYWREALGVFGARPGTGAGAGAFGVARTRYRTGILVVRQAHGYVPETLASLGLLGLAVSLALLAAWLAGAARATGLRRRDRGLPMDAERVGLLTLTAVVVTFGAHSLIDWTWLIPGTALVALVCAAWVVGRGPLRDRLGLEPAQGAGASEPDVDAVAPNPIRPLRLVAAAAVLLIALAAAWSTVQPLRAERAIDVAYDRLDAGSAVAAVGVARTAVRRDPLSLDPRLDLAALQDATGDRAGAERTLEAAVERHPANAGAWRRLGEYRALQLGRPQTALAPVRAAYYLDPQSPKTTAAFLLLRRQLAAVDAQAAARRAASRRRSDDRSGRDGAG